MKAIISYFDRQELVSSAQEATDFINSLTFRNSGKGAISANDFTVKRLNQIFNDCQWEGNLIKGFNAIFSNEIATTGCSTTRIYLYRPLGDTLEEHMSAYQAKIDAERRERLAEAQRRKERRLNELNEERDGWYYVVLNDIKVIGTFNRGNDHPIYKDFSGKVIAKSGADAYRKAVAHLEDTMMNDCTTRNFTYWHHECPDMMSGNYYFSYIGIITDVEEF